MALSSRSLITKTGISTTQVFDMGGINISGGDFNLGSAIKLGNASGIITATTFSGSFTGTISAGESTFSGNILPNTDSSHNIGSNGVRFANIYGDALYGVIQNTTHTNITRVGTLSQLAVSGSANPLNITHTSANCVNLNRGGKSIAIDVNYGGSNTHSLINLSSGMDLRFKLGGTDKIVFKSAGHIEPQTDSQINLGSNSVRFANLYADTLYGDGSNLTSLPAQATIANNADNRVITGGSGVNLNGEATLTFDGTTLTTSGSGGINISQSGSDLTMNSSGGIFTGDGGNATNPIVANVSDTNTGFFYPAADTISVTTGGSERFRITSDGDVNVLTGHIQAQDLKLGLVNNRYPIIQRAVASAGSQSVAITGGSGYSDNTASSHTPTDAKQGALIQLSAGNPASDTFGGGIKYYANGHTSPNNPGAGNAHVFYTRTGVDTFVERVRIASDGKLYKGGNQFYPLVNYVEVGSFSGINVSASSYTDLRVVYSNYSPKKAGNRIVIHHQSQMWNGAAGTGNGDVFWRIMRDEGSGYSAFVTNERILGNHDGSNYTGGSGLARHHRTVHLMGSFICNGNNFNLKTQGRSMGIGWDWYHDANNILQIWEYELN